MNETRHLDNAHTLDSIQTGNLDIAEASNQFPEMTNFHQLGLISCIDRVEIQQSKALKTSPKRAKVTHPDGTANVTRLASSRAKGKQKRCLSLLLEMPLDVLYEIFSHLQPRDIINLTRTSKIFRETLLSRSAITIWKAVCDREDAPECPSWISQPAWVALLFEHVCQSCGARNIQKIDFLLLKRVCLKCKKLHLVSFSGIFTRYPAAYGLNVSRLLPATNISSWSHKYTRKSEFYWDTDVDDVVTRLSALKQDIDRGIPDAQKLQDDFQEEQKRRVKYIKENFALWNDWHTNKKSAKRMASIFDSYATSLRKTMISSQALSGVVASGIPPPSISDIDINFERDFGQWFSPKFEDMDFERDFAQWFNSEEGDANFERDFGQWFNSMDEEFGKWIDGLESVTTGSAEFEWAT